MSTSLAFEGLELAGAARALDHELVARLRLDDAGVDHLRHQVGGHLAGLILLLECLHLLLEIGQPELDLVLRFRGHALMQALEAKRLDGVIDLTPGIRSLHRKTGLTTTPRVAGKFPGWGRKALTPQPPIIIISF